MSQSKIEKPSYVINPKIELKVESNRSPLLAAQRIIGIRVVTP